MYCIYCGNKLNITDKYCDKCGRSSRRASDLRYINQLRKNGEDPYQFCPECDTLMLVTDIYCNECGSKLTSYRQPVGKNKNNIMRIAIGAGLLSATVIALYLFKFKQKK